jgi:DNA-binding transcriptional regulator YiaG
VSQCLSVLSSLYATDFVAQQDLLYYHRSMRNRPKYPAGKGTKIRLHVTREVTIPNPIPAEIESLRGTFGSQSVLAVILNVDRSSVTRWLHGEDAPDPKNEERITALRYVMARLQKIFRTEAAIAWLKGMNAHLAHQRPLDLLREGRVAEVISAIEQTEAGSYA